jgi:hypothetical protein
MVIGSDGKWSEALKDAFIQASPAGPVKMPPPPAFPVLNRAAGVALNQGAGVVLERGPGWSWSGGRGG